ncbi:beta-lactamase family protein [bacterium]|nr:beta-lactamase family protein [bacterium]
MNVLKQVRIFIAVAASCAALSAHAQIDMRATARLHFRAQEDSANWFEGYARMLSGTPAPYPSHRSEGAPASAFVARTQGSEASIVWETAALPPRWAGTHATFVWACGLGSNLGEEKFRITLNDKHEFVFSSLMQPAWQVEGEAGSRLAFTAVYQNHNRAYFGYMTLRVPVTWVRAGLAASIKITGVTAAKEIWYRTFAYTDALAFLRKRESKRIFSELKFWNLGDAELQLFAHANLTGQSIAAFFGRQQLGEKAFELESDLAVARLTIPREQQHENDAVVLRLNGETVDTVALRAITEKRIKAFLEEELLAEQYVFPPGKLPGVQWKRPAMVDNELGKFALRVSYYDKNMNRVERATAAGRYAAVAEGVTPDGFTIKRYLTLYCAPIALDDYGGDVSIQINALPALGISPALWQKYQNNFRAYSFGNLLFYLQTSPDAAIFLAGLAEMDTTQHGLDSPRLRDRQWWIRFKRKQEGLNAQPISSNPPQRHARPVARELIEASNEASPYTASDLEKIRSVCRDWARDASEPFTALLAHQGRMIFHEAFGTLPDGSPMTVDTPTWMASITKLLTGVLLMQFVDQGLLDLDAPLQRYLPEMQPLDGVKLTLRHAVTHTHGGAWHGEWGSDWNPALENFVAHGLPYFEVGKNFQYNRLGYALAGKVMERLSGRAVPYLMEECLFKPLNMQHATVDNTYGSLYATSHDLAKFAQMLLNRGSYGEYSFFSAESFDRLLPASLEAINPQIQQRWGIGAAPLGGHGLSDKAFGHEAASGAIFRMDPAQELILIVGRNHAGVKYDHFASRFIEACTLPLRAAPNR